MSMGSWLKTQMKQKLKAIFKGPVVFYPLLFAAFPILFLYAHNIRGTSASQVWLPLIISVAAALVLWAVLSRAPLVILSGAKNLPFVQGKLRVAISWDCFVAMFVRTCPLQPSQLSLQMAHRFLKHWRNQNLLV